MKKIIRLLVWSVSLVTPIFAEKLPLIIDHDNGVDDVIATTLQLLSTPERVKSITVVPADSYAQPAAWVMMHLTSLFLPTTISVPIGVSTNAGINPFPSEWREDAWGLARLPVWGKNTEEALHAFPLESVPSSLAVLTNVLQESPTQVDILETGPCTNITEVLLAHPELKDKIHRMYMMGGALYVKGNVTETGRDGSAEWNIYNNPQAFQDLLKTKIPLTLIALDATQYTPISKEFMAQVKNNLTIKACQLVDESLQIIKPLIDLGVYFFWDTLTSAVVINPEIIKTKKVKINVITDGPSAGKIFEDNNGFEVNVAVWANQELFEKTVLDILIKGQRATATATN